MVWNYQPLSDYTLSSGFGTRTHPITGQVKRHQGIDLAAPRGSQVYSPTDLTITFAGQQSGYGNLVIGRTLMGEQIYFGHLDSIGVRAGDTLAPGVGLGTVGSTGASTNPHLHLGVKDSGGNWIDPSNLMDTALNKGKQLISEAFDKGKSKAQQAGEKAAVAAANAVVPGSGEVLQAFGIGADCNWWCQIKQWLKFTDIGVRFALIFLGIVIIGGGFMLLATSNINVLNQAKNW